MFKRLTAVWLMAVSLNVATANAANYIYEAAPSGQVRHAATSQGSGTYATLAAAQTADTWTGNTITLSGASPLGQVLPTGRLVVASGITITMSGEPILTHTVTSGSQAVLEINANVTLTGGAWRVRNLGTVGSNVRIEPVSSNLTVTITAPLLIDQVGAGSGNNPFQVAQTSSYYVNLTADDITLNAGVGLPDGISLSGNPPSPGTIVYRRCYAYGCTQAANSNGFSFDGSCIATLIDCVSDTSGGPGIVGGAFASASFNSRIRCYGCTVRKSGRAFTTGQGPYAIYAEVAERCIVTDCISGIAITGPATDDVRGSVSRCIIECDQTLGADATANNIHTAIMVDVRNFVVTNNIIRNFRFAKDGTYYDGGIRADLAGGATYSGVITGNLFENVNYAVEITSRAGDLMLRGNVVYNDNLALNSGSASCNVFSTYGVDGSNQLRLTLLNNIVMSDVAGATNSVSYLVRLGSTSVNVALSGGNYWWKQDTTNVFFSYTAAASDNASGLRTGSGNKPIFTEDVSGNISSLVPLTTSPAFLYATGDPLFETYTAPATYTPVNVMQWAGSEAGGAPSTFDPTADSVNVGEIAGVAVTGPDDLKADMGGMLTASDVWNYATADATIAGSIGKRVSDNLDASISSRSVFDPGTTSVVTNFLDVGAIAQVTECADNAARALGLHRLISASAVSAATAGSFLDLIMNADGDQDYNRATDSLQAVATAAANIDVGIGGSLTRTITLTADSSPVPYAWLTVRDASGTTIITRKQADENGVVSIDPDNGTAYTLYAKAVGATWTNPISRTWTGDGSESIDGTAETVTSPDDPTLCTCWIKPEQLPANTTQIYAVLTKAPVTSDGVVLSSNKRAPTIVGDRLEWQLPRGAQFRFVVPTIGFQKVIEVPDADSANVATTAAAE